MRVIATVGVEQHIVVLAPRDADEDRRRARPRIAVVVGRLRLQAPLAVGSTAANDRLCYFAVTAPDGGRCRLRFGEQAHLLSMWVPRKIPGCENASPMARRWAREGGGLTTQSTR